jgi:hypothetical protein
MTPVDLQERSSAFETLRRLARPETKLDRCEFCSLVLAAEHRHLLEISARKILCVCDPCGLRFQNVVGGRFKLIPRDARALPAFRITETQWESLSLPINLAFFLRRTSGQVTALYPSPAGATESLLPLENWQAIVADNPVLADLEPEVEALLVNRVGTQQEYFIAPIDRCFELVGLIRLHWRGLSGGETVWVKIKEFFAQLQAHTSREVSLA